MLCEDCSREFEPRYCIHCATVGHEATINDLQNANAVKYALLEKALEAIRDYLANGSPFPHHTTMQRYFYCSEETASKLITIRNEIAKLLKEEVGEDDTF